jgi:hypothetical protein
MLGISRRFPAFILLGMSRFSSSFTIRPNVESSVLFICDVQERFRPLIQSMPTVISRCELMNNICQLLEIPCCLSEQYPKALGSTVTEITRFPNNYIYPKMKFSMINDDLMTRYFRCESPKKQVSMFEDEICCIYNTVICSCRYIFYSVLSALVALSLVLILHHIYNLFIVLVGNTVWHRSTCVYLTDCAGSSR